MPGGPYSQTKLRVSMSVVALDEMYRSMGESTMLDVESMIEDAVP